MPEYKMTNLHDRRYKMQCLEKTIEDKMGVVEMTLV